jgi:VWFA-related protein
MLLLPLGMRPFQWKGLTLAFASLLAGAVLAAQTSGIARFRGGIDLVALDVCVTDRAGRVLPALGEGDFLVFEDRVPQTLKFFSPAGKVPLTAVILIDRSSSMTGTKLARAKAAAMTFLHHLGPDDSAEVLAFNQSTERIVPFGADVTAATSLVDRIRADGQTALFNAVVVALDELRARRPARDTPRREAVVVLSDGEDSNSGLTFEEAHAEVQHTGMIVYSVSIRVDAHDRPLPPLHEFAQLANDSGGRAVAVTDLATLEAVYTDIAAELHHMYRLAYAPAAIHDGRWHVVDVRVIDRQAHVRTRAGYFAPRSTPPQEVKP